MGNFRGLIRSSALSGVVLIALAGCSSSKATEQKRRELLTPPKALVQPQAKKPKPSITDKDGVPLPSDVVLGGFQVPLGFELTKSYDNEWFLHSLEVSAQATAKYVEARLFTGSLERTTAGGMRFESAQLRNAPQAPRLSVRISPIKNHEHACELYIRRIPVEKDIKRTAESVAQTLRDSARYAQ